jgi:hypothetical protein
VYNESLIIPNNNNNNNNNNNSVRAQLLFDICKEIGVKLDNEHGMTLYQNQSKQVMKVKLPYYGTNKCEPKELFLTINRTS